MTDGPILGIDLGTTYSLACVMQAGRPVLIENAMGEYLTPSAVGLDEDGRFLVGAAARARAASHPNDTVRFFKRDMGTDRTHRLGDRELTPQDLSAMVLQALREDAERALGVTIAEAVVTVPAYFGDAQRQATRDAGAIAGLKVERIVNEPTAAALAYGLHHRDRELTAVVVDLGGGTFDVTVLEILEGVIEIQASAGDARLGGEDFTDVLAQRAIKRLRDERGIEVSDPDRPRVREACERVKRRLTVEDRAELVVVDLGGEDVTLEITRAEADRLWLDLLSRMRAPIIRALRDASVRPEDVEEVLMVGGATRMRCVREMVAELFGKMPNVALPPDETVAQGAAVQAALKADDEAVDDLVVTDVAPFTMGIATGTKVGVRTIDGLFTPVLERGTVIPASRVQRFFTLEANQRQLLVEIFQGEHSLCRDNNKLGEYMVEDLPRGRAGDVWVDVRFTYDLNGILEVEMKVMDTERVEHLVIEKRPGKLSNKEIREARAAMKRIKFHPRESLPNRTALARADALYTEVTGVEREMLGQLLAAFRAVLETQQPEEIDPVRAELNALVDSLRR